MNKGKLISFEGIEGVGKSTTINHIRQFLEKNEIKVYCTREPGGTKFGESVRNILLNNKSMICSEAELLLMFAIRNQHIEEIIIPKLDKGTWILCDRFIDASFAYQGYGKKVELNKIELLVKNFTKEIQPDLTIFFDLNHNLAKKRFPKNKRKDRFENLNDKFFNDVYNGYVKLSNSNKKRIKVVDANQSKEKVRNEITNIIVKTFNNFSF
tara:strand:+ start:179 stop:811 length:633 start_codon:yes stop_codon:yes gene_type:complete